MKLGVLKLGVLGSGLSTVEGNLGWQPCSQSAAGLDSHSGGLEASSVMRSNVPLEQLAAPAAPSKVKVVW